MAALRSRRPSSGFDAQRDASQVAEAFQRTADAVDLLRDLDAPLDWFIPSLQDAADDLRGHIEARADDETIDWGELDAALERLEPRAANKGLQLQLL